MLQKNLRKTKSLNTNNQKSKKKQVQTNRQILLLQTPMTILKGTETKYQMKTKRVLISKEQNTDIKKKKDLETRRTPHKSSFTNNIANRKKKNYEELN